jgi:hypothetical protein
MAPIRSTKYLPPSHTPIATSAYILFRSGKLKLLNKSIDREPRKREKLLMKLWREAPKEVKLKYQIRAERVFEARKRNGRRSALREEKRQAKKPRARKEMRVRFVDVEVEVRKSGGVGGVVRALGNFGMMVWRSFGIFGARK